MLKASEVAKIAALAMDEKLGKNITVMKTTDVTVLADYFVICTANSSSHVKSLTDTIEFRLEEVGEPALKREGDRNSGWILLDFGCVICHVFMEEAREFYDLERLWADAERVEIESL